jgi:hypothetical protein
MFIHNAQKSKPAHHGAKFLHNATTPGLFDQKRNRDPRIAVHLEKVPQNTNIGVKRTSRDVEYYVKMGALNPWPRCMARKAMTIIHVNPIVRIILHIQRMVNVEVPLIENTHHSIHANASRALR